MDTWRHVGITQPISAALLGLLGGPALLGLLGGPVGSQGNRDGRTGQERRARCDAAEEGLTHHPQRVAVRNPQGSLRFQLESRIESATWLIHVSKWKRMFTRRQLSR